MKRNFASTFLFSLAALLVSAVVSSSIASAQTAPSIAGKAYFPTATKGQAAAGMSNPAANGGIAAFDFGTFQFSLAGVDVTNQFLALLGGRGSQLYINPAGTSMTAYVAGTFTGVPMANPPVRAQICTFTGQCVNNDRYLRFASGYPNPAVTTNTIFPLESFTNGNPQNASFSITAVPFTTNTTVVINKFAGVGNSQNGTTIWNGFNAYLRIWQGTATTTPMQEFDASPTFGNVVGEQLLSVSHVPFNNNHYVTYTPPSPIVLPAGQYWISVAHNILNSTGGHNWGFKMTNNNSIPVDYRKWKFLIMQPASPTHPWNTVQGVPNPGAVALDFIGN